MLTHCDMLWKDSFTMDCEIDDTHNSGKACVRVRVCLGARVNVCTLG